MTVSEQIIKLAAKNNGVLTTATVSAHGIYRGDLQPLLDAGKLEKTARGFYVLPGVWEDEFVNLQVRFKKGIFSFETALFLWDLTDRTPSRYSMTFPQGYNLTNAKQAGIDASTVKKEWYEKGKTSTSSPSGHQISLYCMERVLCDLLRKRDGVDKSVLVEAFKRYVSLKNRNIPLLSEYAKVFSVSASVRSYLEVLL